MEIQIQDERKELLTDTKRKQLVDLTISDMKIDLRKYKRKVKEA